METPEFFRGGAAAAGFHYNSPFNNSEKRFSDTMKNSDHFIVDELLDFPNDDVMMTENFGTFDSTTVTGGTSTDSSVVTVVDTSCNSSFAGSTTEPASSSCFPVGGDIGCRNFTDGQFSSELCVPYDDLAELEWLSNFVEESFSSEDLQKMQLISGMKAQTHDVSQNHQFQTEPNRATSATLYRPEMAVPAKARSKRSRAPTCNWTSRLLAVSHAPPTTITATAIVNPAAMSSSSESDVVGKKAAQKKKETYENGLMSNCEGRKCFHCATDKTPQWRTGPMGPKTLCNACGVRYKSGRLVPEYRPAASPTFMLTKHSNSHRKVIELRRQNEFFRAQQQQQQHQHQQQQQQQQFLHDNMMFDVSNGDDFLIQHHLGTDYRQLI